MKATAVFLLGNNFLRISVENHDDPPIKVAEDMKVWGRKVGLSFMYLEGAE
jgi:hypothetical protein